MFLDHSFEHVFQNQVITQNATFHFLILMQFARVCRMMRLDEIDPTKVEGAEAAANLETAGYVDVPSMGATFRMCSTNVGLGERVREAIASIGNHSGAISSDS